MATRWTGKLNGERYLGNTNTKEIHDLDNELTRCQIDNIISAGHEVPFKTLKTAVDMEYDPCHWCLGSSILEPQDLLSPRDVIVRASDVESVGESTTAGCGTGQEFAPTGRPKPGLGLAGDKSKRISLLPVFLSYSPRDENLREKFETHLAGLKGRIAIWHHGKILAGEARAERISEHLEGASLVLLLVSPDFLVSEDCEKEVHRALERRAAGTTHVVPILLRHCLWQEASFGDLQPLPRDGKPVEDRDAAWATVVKGIGELVDSLL